MQSAGTGPSKRRGRFLRAAGVNGGQDFELNLAPVIDCLTVLITFVLISASYISVGVLQAELAVASTTPTMEQKSNDEMLTVELKDDHSILVSLVGKKSHVSRINPNPDRSWNYKALGDNLALTKSQLPNLTSLVLNADSDVDYREVIKTMELARKSTPSVLLGGY